SLFRLEITVDFHTGNIFYPLVKHPHPLLIGSADCINPNTFDVAECRIQSCDSMPVECACLQCRRHFRRMMMIVCLYSASSHLHRTNLQSFSHIKPAGSLRAQESFVSCKAEYIHMHGFDINRENPRRLGCIHNIENTMVMCHLSVPSNINQISRQIGSVCRHDGLCLWTD